MHKRLCIAFIFSVFVECLNKIVPLIVLNFAQKKLGIEAFGYAQVGIGLVEIAIPFIIWGYSNYGIISIGKLVSNNDYINARFLVSNIILARLIHAVVAFLIIVSVVLIIPFYHKYYGIVISLSFVLVSTAFDGTWILIGIQKVTWLSLITAIGRFLSLFAIIMLVSNPEHAVLYAVLTLMSNAFIAIACFVLGLNSLGYLILPSISQFKLIFKSSFVFGIVGIIFIIFNRADLILSELFLNTYQAGLYSGAVRLNHSFLTILNAAAVAFFAEAVIIRDIKKLKAHVELGLWVILSISLPVVLVLWFVGDDVLSLILGNKEFAKMCVPLGFLTAGSLIEGLIVILGLQVLFTQGKAWYFLKALVLGLFVWISASLMLVNYFAQAGLSFAVILGKFISFILIYYYSSQILGFLSYEKFVKTFVASFLMLAVLILCAYYELHFWMLHAFLSLVTYLFAQIVFNFSLIKSIILEFLFKKE